MPGDDAAVAQAQQLLEQAVVHIGDAHLMLAGASTKAARQEVYRILSGAVSCLEMVRAAINNRQL